MSLYKISSNSASSSLTAHWNTNSQKTRLNINIGTKFVATIEGFDGFSNIPVLFSNDRLTNSSNIITSEDNLNTLQNESIPIQKNINLIVNDDIIKAISSQGFKN